MLWRAWQRLWVAWTIMGERQLSLVAAGVAFYAMLAIFPALAALIALVGFWADPVVVQDTLTLLADFVPPEAFAIIADQVQRLISVTPRYLGWASALSILAAAWSARLGVGALAQGLNAIYGGVQRSGLSDIALVLALTAVQIGVGMVAIAAILVAPLTLAILSPFLPPGSSVPMLAEWIRWGVSGVALVVGLGLFYRYGPNRPDRRRSPFLSSGLFLALAIWGLASVGFSVFLANFGDYNAIYGSIAAVIALLMWFYLSAFAVLMGGALNCALETDLPPVARAA